MKHDMFVFKKNMKIGEPDAEADHEFLSSCFLDTGDLDALKDTSQHQCIILGRTGTGKSALISELKNHAEHCIEIDPQELSLSYISNSTILKFFESLGVDLDLFYNLLWRHILAVELIKYKYDIRNEETKRGVLARFAQLFEDDVAKVRALDYFDEWGGKFWLETERRIHEITEKMEDKLKGALKLGSTDYGIDLEKAKTLGLEVKAEIKHNAQNIVSSVQIKELNRLIELLADYSFDDDQQKYYIVIDKLDEKWVDDSLRYRLIRALIETIKVFKKIPNVKIAIAIRRDLLDRVFENTRDAGFQLEKYENYFLSLGWTSDQLVNLLDRRINHVFEYKYTKGHVYFKDIFPGLIHKQPTAEYILKRTLLRPRDVIMFVNACIEEAANTPQITVQTVKNAEERYSAKRLESLCYEWYSDYPLLNNYVGILRNRSSGFELATLANESFDDYICDLIGKGDGLSDKLLRSVTAYFDGKISKNDYINELVAVLYRTGCIGVKYDGPSSTVYCQNGVLEIDQHRLKHNSRIYVQRMLWAALKINAPQDSIE